MADSFDGRTLRRGFAKALIEEWVMAINNLAARQFYQWCQSDNWETLVNQDTEALLRRIDLGLS